MFMREPEPPERIKHTARSLRHADESAGMKDSEPTTSYSAGTPAAMLLALQRHIGNAAVATMVSGLYDLKQPVQRSAVHEVLQSPGQPLDEPTRTEMESRLGADFSDVRVHTGPAARQSAAEIQARAYTSGSHVVIGERGGDKHTLAHELTHVVQQKQGPVAGSDNGSGLIVSDPDDRFERAAEANAKAVLRGPVPETAAAQRRPTMQGDAARTRPFTQRAPASSTHSSTASRPVAEDNTVFADTMAANPSLWTDLMGNYWVGTGTAPEQYPVRLEQHCAYMAVHWLLNGPSSSGLRFQDLNAERRVRASDRVRSWAGRGEASQTQYAISRLGGHRVSLANLTSDASAGSLPVGTRIWFGNSAHAEAALVTERNQFLMYDPNTGKATSVDSAKFCAYIANKDTFVLRLGPNPDTASCKCCIVM